MIARITEQERKHYEAALAVIPLISALNNRVIVIQVQEEDKLVDDELMSIPGLQGRSIIDRGGLFIPKSAQDNLKKEKNELVKAVVKSIGHSTTNSTPEVKYNDLVLVFPDIYETKINLQGFDFFVYGHADLVAKCVPEGEDIYDHSTMD